MEIDTINAWRAWMSLIAEALDYYRIVPRVILILYGWFFYTVSVWYMGLSEPTTQHTTFVSTVVGVLGIIVGLYQKSGKSWGDHGFRLWPHKDPNECVQKILEEAEDK